MRTEELSVRADRVPDYDGPMPRQGTTTLGGVHFVEVSVDTEAGRIHVERVLAIQDCGRPMNPLALESQVRCEDFSFQHGQSFITIHTSHN